MVFIYTHVAYMNVDDDRRGEKRRDGIKVARAKEIKTVLNRIYLPTQS